MCGESDVDELCESLKMIGLIVYDYNLRDGICVFVYYLGGYVGVVGMVGLVFEFFNEFCVVLRVLVIIFYDRVLELVLEEYGVCVKEKR